MSKRTEAILLNLTPEEKARLSRIAENSPLGSMSAVLRALILSVDDDGSAFVVNGLDNFGVMSGASEQPAKEGIAA